MVQSLQLGTVTDKAHSGIVRINRRPLFLAAAMAAIFLAVLIIGLLSRGLYSNIGREIEPASGEAASSFADKIKSGVGDAIIGEQQVTILPRSAEPQPAPRPTPDAEDRTGAAETPGASIEESEEAWRERLEREHREQYLRERYRQHLARLQALAAARDAPLAIGKDGLGEGWPPRDVALTTMQDAADRSALNSALRSMTIDPNGQQGKEAFLGQGSTDPGYLANRIVAQRSPRELKRGSIIPATLVSGANSDLPGRLIAQVSQNVFDTATGRHLLIPQGTKLFGRYDSKVSFGQSRLLTVWTDLIFPDGSTLQIDGMPGTDSEGYGGFTDKVDRKLLQTYGSAALIALIGAGTGLVNPTHSRFNETGPNFGDVARTSFSEVFGRLAEGSIRRNMDVQPTVEIRPGYRFNIVVDQDIVFDTIDQ